MSDEPDYQRVWVHRILRGSRLVTTHPFDDADEYVRADVAKRQLELLRLVVSDVELTAADRQEIREALE